MDIVKNFEGRISDSHIDITYTDDEENFKLIQEKILFSKRWKEHYAYFRYSREREEGREGGGGRVNPQW